MALNPSKRDYRDLVTELIASKLLGEGSTFDRCAHIPVTHMDYFKPPFGAFLSEFNIKDHRSAKEWNYINVCGSVFRTGVGGHR